MGEIGAFDLRIVVVDGVSYDDYRCAVCGERLSTSLQFPAISAGFHEGYDAGLEKKPLPPDADQNIWRKSGLMLGWLHAIKCRTAQQPKEGDNLAPIPPQH